MRLRQHARRASGRAREGGAAAVEFALVLTLLVPVLFGIVDYGLWFSDSLAARHGVHEASRLGVVNRPSCTAGATDLAKMVCTTRQQVGASGGPTYAMVKSPQGWKRGNKLLVCAMVRENAVTGLTPFPGDRMIRTKASMAIEVDSPLPTGVTAVGESVASDTAPAGTDWAWCT